MYFVYAPDAQLLFVKVDVLEIDQCACLVRTTWADMLVCPGGYELLPLSCMAALTFPLEIHVPAIHCRPDRDEFLAQHHTARLAIPALGFGRLEIRQIAR